MNYVKKLKLAKEALESGSYDKETIEYIFPELKENKDEKIRRALLEMVHDVEDDELWADYNVHKEEMIAWLEKHKAIWYPAKEQIEALVHFVNITPYDNNTKAVCSLLRDLEMLYNQNEKNTIKIV